MNALNFILVLLVTPGASFLNTLVIWKGYTWFAVPFLSAPNLGYWQTLALWTLFGLVTMRHTLVDQEKAQEAEPLALLPRTFSILMVFQASFLFMYILHLCLS